MVQECLAGFAHFGGNFGEPDGGFDGLDLTEEGADGLEVVVTPVLEEAGGFAGDEPIGGIGEIAPLADLEAQFVDDGGVGVLLLFGGEAVAFIEDDGLLGKFCLLGCGMGEMNSALRRVGMVRWVGCPRLSNSQWLAGMA